MARLRLACVALVLVGCGTVQTQDPDASPRSDGPPPGELPDAQSSDELARLETGTPNHDFGNGVVGRQSAQAVVVVTNTGTARSGTLTVELVGGGAAHFDITDNCSGATLGPSERCEVQIYFAPTAAGAHTATLRVHATPGGDAATVLVGAAVAPGALVASVEQLVFGSVELGAPMTPQPIEVRNTGVEPTAPLAVGLGDGTSFEIVADGCNGAVLAPAGTCSISIAFSPDTVGTKASSVTISGGSAGSVPVPLGGVATATISVVVAGALGGAVRSTPAGIDCGEQCAASFSATSVRLEAVPASGAAFGGWSQACQGTGAVCEVAMDRARTVGARFTYGLHVQVSNPVGGRGGRVVAPAIAIDCGTACDARLTAGQTVELEARPDAGLFFREWRGACTGSGVCRVTATADATVEAVFAPELDLRVDHGGDEHCGTITSEPAGIQCGATCAARFVHGTRITLTATPVAGRCFRPTFVDVTCESTSRDGTCTFTLTRSTAASVRWMYD